MKSSRQIKHFRTVLREHPDISDDIRYLANRHRTSVNEMVDTLVTLYGDEPDKLLKKFLKNDDDRDRGISSSSSGRNDIFDEYDDEIMQEESGEITGDIEYNIEKEIRRKIIQNRDSGDNRKMAAVEDKPFDPNDSPLLDLLLEQYETMKADGTLEQAVEERRSRPSKRRGNRRKSSQKCIVS